MFIKRYDIFKNIFIESFFEMDLPNNIKIHATKRLTFLRIVANSRNNLISFLLMLSPFNKYNLDLYAAIVILI